MKPVRWSDLRWMRKSPAHYLYHRDNPTEATKAMRIGSAVHALVLTGIEPVVYDGTRTSEWPGICLDGQSPYQKRLRAPGGS